MDRRKFVVGAGAAIGAAGLGLPTPAVAQGLRELRMVTTWPKNWPGNGTSAERLAETINMLSAGRLRVEVLGADQLVSTFESFDAVASGVADMYHAVETYWHDRSVAFNYFSTVPFGFTAAEMSAWIHFGGGQALWDELSAGFGLKPFLCGSTGAQMAGWFTKELTGIESYRGLRYRMAGLGGEVLRRLGAVVVQLPVVDIIPSLQSGAIDASEWIGPWSDMVLGLHEAARFYYYPGFHEPGTALSLAVNSSVWDDLGSTERAIIEAAAAAEYTRSLAEFTANNAASLALLVEDPAIEVRKLDDTILTELGRISGEVLAETGLENDLSRRVYESFTSFRGAVTGWSDVAERSFLNARALTMPMGG